MMSGRPTGSAIDHPTGTTETNQKVGLGTETGTVALTETVIEMIDDMNGIMTDRESIMKVNMRGEGQIGLIATLLLDMMNGQEDQNQGILPVKDYLGTLLPVLYLMKCKVRRLTWTNLLLTSPRLENTDHRLTEGVLL